MANQPEDKMIVAFYCDRYETFVPFENGRSSLSDINFVKRAEIQHLPDEKKQEDFDVITVIGDKVFYEDIEAFLNDYGHLFEKEEIDTILTEWTTLEF